MNCFPAKCKATATRLPPRRGRGKAPLKTGACGIIQLQGEAKPGRPPRNNVTAEGTDPETHVPSYQWARRNARPHLHPELKTCDSASGSQARWHASVCSNAVITRFREPLSAPGACGQPPQPLLPPCLPCRMCAQRDTLSCLLKCRPSITTKPTLKVSS